MLEIKDMVVAYGRVTAVKGISFTVEKGQVVTLLGTNGAGKSTTLRAISGLLKLVSGSITFEGEKLDGMPAHKIVERGIAQSPEGGACSARCRSRTTSSSARTPARTRLA